MNIFEPHARSGPRKALAAQVLKEGKLHLALCKHPLAVGNDVVVVPFEVVIGRIADGEQRYLVLFPLTDPVKTSTNWGWTKSCYTPYFWIYVWE